MKGWGITSWLLLVAACWGSSSKLDREECSGDGIADEACANNNVPIFFLINSRSTPYCQPSASVSVLTCAGANLS